MAKRARAVRPDVGFTLQDGQTIGAVSDEALIDEVTSVLPLLNFMGGTMSVIVARHPTGVPGESVTVGAMIQWSTNAKAEAEPVSPARRVEVAEPEYVEAHADVERVEAMQEQVDLSEKIQNLEPDTAFNISPPMERYEDPTPEELEEALAAQEERIPEGAVVVGAPVGSHIGDREGVGAGALPFGRDGAPTSAAPPEINLSDVVSKSAVPDPQAPPPGGGRPAGFHFDDGLDEGSLADEDDSAIPENLR